MTDPSGAAKPTSSPNPVGLTLIGVGALLGVLAFTVLDWFHGTLGVLDGSRSKVGDIGDLLDQLVVTRHQLDDHDAIHLGLSQYYYSWLAWVLIAAAVVVAVVAALPTSEGGQVRVLGVLLAVLGVVATLWAIDVYRPAHDAGVSRGPSFKDFLDHTSIGAWCAIAAFVLIGAGALLGPRRTPALRTASVRVQR